MSTFNDGKTNHIPHDHTKVNIIFRYEQNSSKIISILEKRLPKSANIYNMCKMYDNYNKPEEMAFYVTSTDSSKNEDGFCVGDSRIGGENAWVLGTYFREDYGMQYTISAPPNAVISAEIKEAFVKCPYINWDHEYRFLCIDFEISPMIWEISTQVIGNSVSSMPCKVYVLDASAAVNQDVTIPDTLSNRLLLQPLDEMKGTEFICKTWKHTVPQKTEIDIQKLLKKNKSAGLHDRRTGNIISCMGVHECGLVGMLHTVPGERGKGYATLVAKYLMKSFAEDKFIPCSAAEIKDQRSVAFHEKLGMSLSHYVDFIKYIPLSW